MSGISRRQVMVGATVALGAVAAGCRTSAPAGPRLSDPAEPVPPIHDRIEALQLRHDAKVGLFAVDLTTERTLSYVDGESFALCSTFKAYAAARVLQKSERGELTLADPVAISQADVLANSPITATRVGGTMTLAELCQAALQRSDNAAANYLLRVIGGPPAITAFARSIGDDKTRLDRWETELNSALPGDPRDTSTPRALGEGYRNLLTGTGLGAAQRQQLEDWMRGNTTSSMRGGLPPGWTSADKTGSGGYGSTNDVGVAFGPDGRRVLLAVMTRSQTDDPKAENLRPLITELTTLAVPWLISPN